MAVALDSLKDTTVSRRRKTVVSVIIVSIIIHLVIGAIAGIFIFAHFISPPEATFEARKLVSIPPKIVDPKMAAAEFEASAPKPTLDQKLASLRPTDFALPDLPPIPMDQVVEFDPSTMVTDSLVGATAGAGAGGGAGGSGGGGGTSGMNFLGIQTQANRVLIMYDISTTVVNTANRVGTPFTKIREETLNSLDGLSINTYFGLVQFARNYAFFQQELVPATDANRANAKEWLERWFGTEGSMPPGTPNTVRGGPGFIEVLNAAFKMNPDVIFVITDGNFYRTTGSGSAGERIPYDEITDAIREYRETRSDPLQLYFIAVGADRDRIRDFRNLVRSGRNSGGEVRELER